MTKPGDVDHYTRVRIYRTLVEKYYDPAQHPAQPAPSGHAHGRPAGSAVACDHPPELRRHPFHRRPGPRRPRKRQRGKALLRAVRCPGTGGKVRRRNRRDAGPLPRTGLSGGYRRVHRGDAGSGGRARGGHFRNAGARGIFGQGKITPGMVHAPGNRRNSLPHPPTAPSPGILHLVYRTERRRQIHHRGSVDVLSAGTRESK